MASALFCGSKEAGDVAAHSHRKTPGPLQSLVADRIFDGERILTGCNVLIHGERIVDMLLSRCIGASALQGSYRR